MPHLGRIDNSLFSSFSCVPDEHSAAKNQEVGMFCSYFRDKFLHQFRSFEVKLPIIVTILLAWSDIAVKVGAHGSYIPC